MRTTLSVIAAVVLTGVGTTYAGYTKGTSICNAAKIRDAANAEREAVLFNAPLLNLPYREGLKAGLTAQCAKGWLEELRTYSLKDAF